MLGVFSQVSTSQICNFPSGNFPSPIHSDRPVIAACSAYEGQPNLWEVAAWEIALLGSCYLGNCPLESCFRENACGKIENKMWKKVVGLQS